MYVTGSYRLGLKVKSARFNQSSNALRDRGGFCDGKASCKD